MMIKFTTSEDEDDIHIEHTAIEVIETWKHVGTGRIQGSRLYLANGQIRYVKMSPEGVRKAIDDAGINVDAYR